MALLGKETFTVERYAAGSYVDGDWVDGAMSSFDIEASLQPAQGQELELLPEASRKRARYKLYSFTELRSINLDDQTTPDVVLTDEGEHHVFAVGNWTRHTTSLQTAHYKYILIRRGADSDASP